MKRILFFGFVLASFSLFGQDTIYYDSNFNKVSGFPDASYYEIIIRNKNDTNKVSEKEYYRSGKIKSWHRYSNYLFRIQHGKQLEFFPDGKIESEIDFDQGRFNGVLKTWYENGQLRRKDSFTLDGLISGKCYTSTGKDTTYFDYMVQPDYPKGEEARQQFLADHIVYPDSARENGIQGVVYINFVVEPDGSLTNIKLFYGDKLLAEEAIRVIKLMPKWNPGYKEGEKVRTKINMPIKFVVIE